jgi:hypothetical protein
LNLEIMEGTVLQHVGRARDLVPIYPEPTPAYVPLSYNPLYYLLAVPFTWLLGPKLFCLRILTILATVGCTLLLYHTVRRQTDSTWWGLIAVGLFAASYHAMDHFFDVAHPDMWMLFSVLLGSHLIDTKRSRPWNLLAVTTLVAAFWFKQHGAWFAVAGVLSLTWHEGLRRSMGYWVTAALLGPGLYFLAGPSLFGSHFLYFTWEMPRGWMELNLGTLSVFFKYLVTSYPLLSLCAVGFGAWTVMKNRVQLDIWVFQFAAAVLCAFLGALDPGSSFNNYIPLGVCFILLGVRGLRVIQHRVPQVTTRRLAELAVIVSFGVLLYDPRLVVVPRDSHRDYADLIATLQELPGPVYAPSIGQFERDFVLFPTAHWVALDDMIRGPGKEVRNHPNTRRLLDPVIHPDGEAFILAFLPLESYPWMAFLDDYYVLKEDFGSSYRSLRVLQVRWFHGWPRYLYRFSPPTESPPPTDSVGEIPSR